MASQFEVWELLGRMAAWFLRKESEERAGVVGARWSWGAVAATSPLTVTVDGDTSPTPASSIGYVPAVGTRVHVVIASGRAIILVAPPT